jgi:predicted transcriptional regulator
MHAKAQPETLTAQELAVMKVVWRLGRATVRDVHDALQRRRPVAYTTVLTMMRILETKGFVTRDETAGRAHVFTPVRPQKQVVGSMVREFVERVFDGAAQPLVVHLMREGRLSEDERAEVLRLIAQSDTPRSRRRKES